MNATDRDALTAIIDDILACDALDQRALVRILRRRPRNGNGFYRKREILAAFRALHPEQGWPVDETGFAARIRTSPVRSLSGVTPLTVLTEPFPCPGRCIFCPSDVRMPKSYLADEPGCQRAEANAFDPYLQTWNRLLAYHEMGHPTAKVELIVLGGTWSFYPERYQVDFVTRCFAAMNDFGAGRDARAARAPRGWRPPRERVDGRTAELSYNEVVATPSRRALAADGIDGPATAADWRRLEAAQRTNEDAACRAVGLVLETRPDHLPDGELVRLRRLGATKVQLGVQSLDDRVLALNRRGHTAAETRRALARLRGAGFKLHVHWMPNLYGSSPQADRADFKRLFDDPAVRPDELKIYPCSLIESAELIRFHADGRWRPYGHEELVALVADCLRRVPRWCRVTRVVRDIPSPEIVAGNRTTNLREEVERRLAAAGTPSRDVRAREVRGATVDPATVRLRTTAYASAVGEQRFLELVTPDDRLAAFLRLSLPDRPAPIAEIGRSALIREVHVYGTSIDFGRRPPGRAQHAGLGRRLVERAADAARRAGYADLAVISAVGTRRYYRGLGFTDGELYQHRQP